MVAKDKTILLPGIACFQPHTVLLQLLKAKQKHHRGSQRDTTGAVVLRWREVILTAFFLFFAELAFYCKDSVFKVNVFPAKAKYLARNPVNSAIL